MNMMPLPPFSRRTCAALLVTLLVAPVARGDDAKITSMPALAAELFASLTPEQRKLGALPYDSKEKDAQQYTGGQRPGIPLKQLDAKQRAMAMLLIKVFTSDYGAKICDAIAAQDADEGGIDKYFLCFFGEPGEGKTYAWRIAEHHLTLVHVDVEKGEPARFGPILLGADPPTLFDAEEDLHIALYAAMNEAERAKAKADGRGTAGEWVKGGVGIKVSELSPTAQAKLNAIYENRLNFFSDEVKQRVRKLVDANGGLRAMHVAFYGSAFNKRCRDGGRWDFKLGNDHFLCDFETSRRHIHMSMKGKLAEK